MPWHILEDPANPMLSKQIKGYTGKASWLPDDKQLFNVYQSSARNCAEKTFGHLKARWHRIIIKKLDLEVKTALVMITAYFVLLNMCDRSTVCHYDVAWDSWVMS